MPPWIWTTLAVAICSAVAGLVGTRLRRRAQRGLHGEDVFDASLRSVGPARHGLTRAWGAPAGAVVTADGDLRWRGAVLVDGRLEGPASRAPRGRELLWVDPWAQVWTVVFQDGTRVELAVAPGDAHFLEPWRRQGE